MEIIGWRLWTSTEVYSSRTHSWVDAPSDNIQALVVYYDPPPYRDVTMGPDEYTLPGETQVKYGRTLPDDKFEEIWKAAHAADVF